MKNKEVVKIQFFRYDITKWRHNVKSFVDLESTHHVLSYEVLHDMVPYGTFDFKIWPWGKVISTHSETHEGQGRSPQKFNSLVAAHMLLSYQVWNWSDKSYSKKRVSLTTYIYINMTLTLKWCHQWRSRHSVTTLQEMLYRCKAYCARKCRAKMITYQKKKIINEPCRP
jgi:hypothetical protein